MMMRWLIVLTVLLSAAPAQAQEADTTLPDTLPENMQGYWGLPDCGEPMDMVIYTPRYILSLTEEESCLQFVETVKQGPDYTLVATDFETFLSRRTNDGLLEEVYPADENLRDVTQSWDELATGQRFEYAHCEAPSNNWYILHGPGIVAMEHIEDMADTCADGVNDTCRKMLFDVADDNGDGALQGFELAYASQIVAYFDSISHHGGNQTEELRGVMNAAKERGTRFGAAVLAAADADGSGDLDMDELVAFWSAEQKGEVIAQVNKSLEGLSDVFAFIRPIGASAPAGNR